MRRRRKKSPGGQRSAPSRPRIALVGFRGVGKSAIARRLCEAWDMPLLSLDEQIERQAGARIEDIVKSSGWQHFRDLEYAELARAATMEKVLLDCGGGIVEEADGSRSERKISLLRQNFFCVYISASEEKLLNRLKSLARNASRPALSATDSPESLMEIFRRREPLYLELAHAVVDVSDTNVAESAFRLTQMFK
ncbi:MAG TPA: shikimate kinase [Turneriella sp.]|nr:shikimate kinase [Turneriella sp.]